MSFVGFAYMCYRFLKACAEHGSKEKLELGSAYNKKYWDKYAAQKIVKRSRKAGQDSKQPKTQQKKAFGEDVDWVCWTAMISSRAQNQS